MSRKSRVITYGSAALLVVVGIAGGIAFGGTFGQLLALAFIGLGLVLAVALVFYEVGLSEDRERAAEEEAAARRREEGAEPRRGLPKRRLDRRRGERRRLR